MMIWRIPGDFMKIMIAGAGKIGSTLTRILSKEGHALTVIDNQADILDTIAEQCDAIGICGNAASMRVLERAGIRETRLLIAVTDADEVNLLACMIAHRLNPDVHTIARIRTPEYREQVYTLRDTFHLNMTINPELEAARAAARLLKYPGFLKIDTFAKGNVDIVELKIDERSPLKDIRLKDLDHIVHCNILICGVKRDGQMIMPDGDFSIQQGDLIYVTASTANLRTLLQNLGMLTKKTQRVLIAGGGVISYYLADELSRTGMACTIVELNEERCRQLSDLLPKATIVHGDAGSQAFLDGEGIDDSDALVTLTGLDELNLIISLFGHYRNVNQVITKLSHTENNRMMDSLPIGSVISPKELAANKIVRYARALRNRTGAAISVHSITGSNAEAIEFIVSKDTRHIGEPLKNLHIRPGVLLASISHQGRVVIPKGDSTFAAGDDVVIVTDEKTHIETLNAIFMD